MSAVFQEPADIEMGWPYDDDDPVELDDGYDPLDPIPPD
jgi:hypothetical protein